MLWLAVSLAPLLLLVRGLHRQIQAVFLILTRRADLATALFSIIFLPGVLLHEGSHYLAARLLRVPTGRFSILPRPLPDGRLQLGMVETASVDWFRDALIGIAPLVTGGLFVAYAGVYRMGLLDFWKQLQAAGLQGLRPATMALFDQPDIWLWFYLAFAVSSTMLPSASDRQAWLPISLMAALLLGLSLLAGAGPWLATHLAPPLNIACLSVATVFLISASLHLVLFIPIFILHHLLSAITGLEVR